MTKKNIKMTKKNVKIRTRTVGQHFACCGVITDLRGRTLVETDDYPYGMNANAYNAAIVLAESKGWIVCA